MANDSKLLSIFVGRFHFLQGSESLYPRLLLMVEKLVNSVEDVTMLLDVPNFLNLVDFFRGERLQMKCASLLLTVFIRTKKLCYSNDYQLANKVKQFETHFLLLCFSQT